MENAKIILEDFKKLNIFACNQKNDISKEELRSYFIKRNILSALGWQNIGKDIRLERTVKGTNKRSDIICIDNYGNITFVIEFKKPSDDYLESSVYLRTRYKIISKAKTIPLINAVRLISNIAYL